MESAAMTPCGLLVHLTLNACLSKRDGNPRVMFVGFSSRSATLLEVGVEFLPAERERIFHANKARTFFQRLYNERKRS